ncbi:hypothetical protein AB0D63_20685 [Kitasatospora sp. NPDC048343]|uniref:hypothetical protein n=1 Tax=Kitasatospora sp. NPDC048343 TaxID=3154717 RepID=UPI0033C42E1A
MTQGAPAQRKLRLRQLPPEELADQANPKASVEMMLGPIKLDGQAGPESLLLRLTPNQLLRYLLDGAELLLQQLPESRSEPPEDRPEPLGVRQRTLSFEEIRERQRQGGVTEDLLLRVYEGLLAYSPRSA